MTTKHYSEADLLETYYTQPGQSMPVMMHLASCSECAARYDRLDRKLREAALCSTHAEKPETFWTRQRFSILRRIDAEKRKRFELSRTARMAAAAALAFFLGGAVVYETVKPALHTLPPAPTRSAPVAVAKPDSVIHDAWQSDELQGYHSMVAWESWVEPPKGDSSL
jgi:predicted anti-sigma-YlaC factor YlaD